MTLKENKQTKIKVCNLCGNSLSKGVVGDDQFLFCCHGCQAVYSILSTKNELENFQEHPLFKQALKSGLISNPDLLKKIERDKENQKKYEVHKLHIEIQDMWCPSCCLVIQYLLLKESGITKCVVDWSTDLALIEYQPRVISKERVIKLIQSLGYSPHFLEDPRKNEIKFVHKLRFIVALFCSLNIMMFSYPLYATYFNYDDQGFGTLFAWFSFIASIPVVTFCAAPIYRKFITSLKARMLGMESLVVLAVIAAFTRSTYDLFLGGTHIYFDSMSVVITLVLLGKLIESKSKYSAKDSLIRLTRSVPKRGRKRFVDGQEDFVLLKDVKIGDHLIVISGEKVPLDGVVIEGTCLCDESLITGESVPVKKVCDSQLIAGAIVNQGWVCLEVKARQEDTFLKHIIEMIEGDIGKKRESILFVDALMKWFVPVICLLSLLSYVTALAFGYGLEDAFIRAVSVLLISCPCAIGIAVPLVEAYMINSLSQIGIVVRNREALFLLDQKCLFAFDKTGTLTEGKFRVLSGLDSLTQNQKSKLKGLVSKSQHPVSLAINSYLTCQPELLSEILEVPGRGIKAQDIVFGSKTFLKECGIKFPESHNNEPVTSVYLAENKQFVAHITLGDQIKDNVRNILDQLSPSKCLLSGDSKEVVEYVAKEVGIKEFYFSMNPLEKRNQIEFMKETGKCVCMVGDGVNDAPSLAIADVGISVVNATDMTVQVSDILFTSDRLELLIEMKNLSIKGKRIVKQNLFWAFFYNTIGLGFAFFGLLSPLFSAFAMVTSSFFVTMNAKRVKNTNISN